MIDETLLKSHTVQDVLDCVPEGNEVIAAVDKIPMSGGLQFKKAITFGSKDGFAALDCSTDGISIRCAIIPTELSHLAYLLVFSPHTGL